MDQVEIETISLSLVRTMLTNGEARQLRINNHLTMGEVAAAVGTTPAMVARWETGQSQPRKGNALRYADLLAALIALNKQVVA